MLGCETTIKVVQRRHTNGHRYDAGMASDKQTATFILDQLADLNVRVHPMFGEYALYCDDKVVGFICDDTLLIKPTPPGSVHAPGLPAGRPYPGAKDYMQVDGDLIENHEWLQTLVRLTADALPTAKTKAPRRKR